MAIDENDTACPISRATELDNTERTVISDQVFPETLGASDAEIVIGGNQTVVDVSSGAVSDFQSDLGRIEWQMRAVLFT